MIFQLIKAILGASFVMCMASVLLMVICAVLTVYFEETGHYDKSIKIYKYIIVLDKSKIMFYMSMPWSLILGAIINIANRRMHEKYPEYTEMSDEILYEATKDYLENGL